jgi:hypothetical protein
VNAGTYYEVGDQYDIPADDPEDPTGDPTVHHGHRVTVVAVELIADYGSEGDAVTVQCSCGESWTFAEEG